MKYFSGLILCSLLSSVPSMACEVDADCGPEVGWTCVNPYHPGDAHDISRCSWYAPPNEQVSFLREVKSQESNPHSNLLTASKSPSHR